MNRKSLISLVSLILFAFPCTVSAQQWVWGKRAQNKTNDIVVDNNGNTYVLWAVGDQANIDGHPIAQHGYTDMAITSFRCDGTYRWTKVIGGASPDAGFGIGTDTLGGLYILGYIGSSGVNNVYVDTDTVINPTLRKIVLIKYDTAGVYKWLRMPEADTLSMVTNSAGFNLTITQDGDAHIMSALHQGAYADGAFMATYPDDQNTYVLKYDKDGGFTGGIHLDVTKPVNAGISSYGFTMIYDPVSTHYYWSGIRYDPYTISFGSTAVTGSNFLACFDHTGSVAWVQKSNNDAIATSFQGKVAIDNTGNIYATGYSYNDFNGGLGDGFGNYDFNNTMGAWGFPILVKFDASGNALYATNASNNDDNSGWAVAWHNGTIGLAGIYAGGNFSWGGLSLGTNNQYYDNFLARFDAATGNILAIDTLSSSPMVNEYPTVLTTDRKGNFYVGGEFDGDINIAGATYTKQDGYTDGYIARFEYVSCDCVSPIASYSQAGSGLSYSFTYTGTTPVDSVVWSFGDNQTTTGMTVSHTYMTGDTFSVCATAYNNCGSYQYCHNLITSGGNVNVGTLSQAFRGISAYPNPVNNTLNIQGLSDEANYQLYNGLGVQVQHGVLPAQNAIIDMQRLPAGWYSLRLYDKRGNSGQMKIIHR